MVSKENHIKKELFSRQQIKLERKDSIGLEIDALISGALI